jgi:membrane protein DedA with SNARE-associated domain
MDIAGLIALLQSSVYFLIFAGCFTEGSVVMITAGVLVHSGFAAFWPALAALMLGDILSDIMWYCMGRFGGRRFMNRWGYLVGATPTIVDKVQHRFHEYHTSILMISKLTMGFGFAIVTLMTAGLLRVPFVRFVAINVSGGLIWVSALFSIGYYFGSILESIPAEMRVAGFFVGALVMFMLLQYANKKLSTVEW